MISSYAVIANAVIENVVLWDGVSTYDPGPGATLTALSSLPQGVGIGWSNASGAWVAPTPTPPTMLSFLQFMGLFTEAEQAAIVDSADTQTRLFVMMATGAGRIDITNAEVVDGVAYLAQTPSPALIAPARIAAILAGQPAS